MQNDVIKTHCDIFTIRTCEKIGPVPSHPNTGTDTRKQVNWQEQM